MKLVTLFFVTAAILSPLNGYAKPVNPGSYASVKTDFRGEDQEEARLKIAKNIKRAQKNSGRAQIIVMPFSDDGKNDSGKVAKDTLKQLLVSAGTEIVDRDLPKALKDELIAYEQSGSSLGASFELADYVFKGEVLDVSVSASFSPASTSYNKEGKPVKHEPRCSVNSQARLNVKFYSMNPLELLEALTLTQNNADTVYNVSSCKGVNTTNTAMGAVRKALERKDGTIKNYFAPRGYIVDHRAKKKDHIFKTTFAAHGTKPKTKVVIYKTVVKQDPITLETSTEKSEVASGKVIAVKGDENVWIKLDKKNLVDEIRLGDLVEVHHEDCKKFSFTNNCYLQDRF
ncbi:hypothetical protein P886_1374 [Alteromonadaceae bacterium 2753L.S.0a.02]|nr:hypothetical protein P886_1374 [Alteromonadaceae bacterium 2753L.S.0a.02]